MSEPDTAPLALTPPESALPEAVARLYGEPLATLPLDLYIPPDALEVLLEAFEGPLDLLLYLIRKASIDILDIPMAQLTTQYLAYVDEMRNRNLDLAADYLLMAATLLDIKSRMLLPRPPRAQEDEDAGDPRAELVRRLLEYEQIKLAAARLDAMPRIGRDAELISVLMTEQVVERLPEVSLHDLQAAWLRLVQRARHHRHHQIAREALSVRGRMSEILRLLDGPRFVVFDALFDASQGVPMLVVSFLAVLELVKERLVDLTQQAAFAPIYVRRAGDDAPVDTGLAAA